MVYEGDLKIAIQNQEKPEILLEILSRRDVKCKVDYGSDGNVLTTYLEMSKFPSENIVNKFIKCGNKVNTPNRLHKTPLLLTIESMKYDDFEVPKILLDNGAIIDAQDDTGKTPLMVAVERNFMNIVTMLLEKKANRSIKDKNSKTAFDYAKTNEMKFLLRKDISSVSVNKFQTHMLESFENKYQSYIRTHVRYIQNNKAEKLVYDYTVGTEGFKSGPLRDQLIQLISNAPNCGEIIVYSNSRYFRASRLPQVGDTFCYPRIMSTTYSLNQLEGSIDTFTPKYVEKTGVCCILVLKIRPPYLFLPNEMTKYKENEIIITPRKFIIKSIENVANLKLYTYENKNNFIVMHLEETNIARDFFDILVAQKEKVSKMCEKLYISQSSELKSLIINNVDETNFDKVKRVFKDVAPQLGLSPFNGSLAQFPDFIKSLEKKQLCGLLTKYYNQ